jgi:hypothetical protein
MVDVVAFLRATIRRLIGVLTTAGMFMVVIVLIHLRNMDFSGLEPEYSFEFAFGVVGLAFGVLGWVRFISRSVEWFRRMLRRLPRS